ncbi:PD-(D/E)XK nuclease-like domain-containing protein [Curtobacterium sp. BRD11]|uniref:PD-(D/E)XK nuclease-like domain-containing protein n=1 Tax=Curtobacterium sp. BRD11 TaxID=2962581 RepID=UPI002881786E|nr:PD-(D/E)XK nuclease-like domain-containing protein [Curtobacterium sp. BRD11]MDT0211211.1 PD-(D/E)XK nuclease-like domain-containing protein [Curtobacterium sp. BRD11]
MTAAIYTDMSEDVYHARPELSSTGARRLLESPARFDYWRRNRQPGKQAFDVGHAVHAMVLGVGNGVIAYPEEHITASGAVSTKAATVAWAEGQRAKGLVPIAPAQARRVGGMADAVLAHPAARAIVEQQGNPEVSVIALDDATGVETRARFDWIDVEAGEATDLKTTSTDASPDGFTRTVAQHGYDVQEAFYRRAIQRDIRFRFLVVETEPPHLVGVHTLDIEWERMGQARVQRALELYAACTATGIWPGYPTEPQLISPPNWLVYQHEDEYGPVETTTVRHL